MSWPTSTPAEISNRAAAVLEGRFPGINARNPRKLAGVLSRVTGLSVYEVLAYQRRLSRELMADTAEDWLERHASIWGITRAAATYATGTVRLTGMVGLAVPSGIALRGTLDQRYTTTAGGTIGGGGTLDVAVQADDAGAAGNASAGIELDLVSPLAGLAAQVAVIQSPGLTGGQPAEDPETLRARLLQRIRNPPGAGTEGDYVRWALSAGGIGYVSVLPSWVGLGTVAVVIALEGPAVASAGDVTRVEAAIEAERPVTATVHVLAATLLAVPLSIRLSPDTTQTRASVQAALATHFVAEAAIGEPMPLSRISEAISSAAGEYSHEITAPASDPTPTTTQLPVLGTITWITA